ncbi:hypothetical protein P3T43_000626 [Paraburkholderia sp. GAS41]
MALSAAGERGCTLGRLFSYLSVIATLTEHARIESALGMCPLVEWRLSGTQLDGSKVGYGSHWAVQSNFAEPSRAAIVQRVE